MMNHIINSSRTLQRGHSMRSSSSLLCISAFNINKCIVSTISVPRAMLSSSSSSTATPAAATSTANTTASIPPASATKATPLSSATTSSVTADLREIQLKIRPTDGTKICDKFRDDLGLIPGVLFGRRFSQRKLIAVDKSVLQKELRERKGSFLNTLYRVTVIPEDKPPVEAKASDESKSNNKKKANSQPKPKVVEQYLAIPRDLQINPINEELISCNFNIYDPKIGAKLKLPLLFMDHESCPGLKKGAKLNYVFFNILCKVTGLDIPNSIHVSLKGKDVGQKIQWSELSVPTNVKLVETPSQTKGTDVTVASLKGKREARQVVAARNAAEAAAAAASGATPAGKDASKDAAAKPAAGAASKDAAPKAGAAAAKPAAGAKS